MEYLKLFDLYISDREQLAYKRACESASEYMETLVRTVGRTARKDGDYFAPDERPVGEEDGWLPGTTAIEYAHISKYRLRCLAEDGTIRRRSYKRKGKRIFYEYSINDICDFINRNSLADTPSS